MINLIPKLGGHVGLVKYEIVLMVPTNMECRWHNNTRVMHFDLSKMPHGCIIEEVFG